MPIYIKLVFSGEEGDALNIVDKLLDAGAIQDVIAEMVEDTLCGGPEITSASCYAAEETDGPSICNRCGRSSDADPEVNVCGSCGGTLVAK